jgi:hypothetical protein
MYLHLRVNDQGSIKATIKNDGDLGTLGTSSSQNSRAPFAVFRIEEFDGIEALDDRALMDEVFRRFSTKDMMTRLQINLTDAEIIAMIRDRLKER